MVERMRNLLIFSAVLGAFALAAQAAEQPRGNVLELHSCELYAGGCIVSSQATLGGRYMLRAWDFTGGNFDRVDFAGLQLAVLQASPENLAAAGAAPGQAVVYLPSSATPREKEALLTWLKEREEFADVSLKTRVVDLQFGKTGDGYSFHAGDFVSVKTAPLESCTAQACGEALWYVPRTESTVFTVALNRASDVNEPLLKLKWYDAGKRSVFLAKTGPADTAKNMYVTVSDLCGPAGSLF